MYELPVKIERFENHFAIMRNEVIGELKWPAMNLPPSVQIDDNLILTAVLIKNDEEEKYARMRATLEELIN